MSKKTRLIFFLSAFVLNVQAQVLTPLDSDPNRTAPLKQSNASLRINGMALPFFDDFSINEGNPDPVNWVQTGGTWVSNRFAKDPISRNVATLDGLNANGEPYGFLKTRETDSLISQPINLSGLQNSNVVLSFYWQAGGTVIYPPGNSTASFPYYLKLEFRKQNGTWEQVWKQDGTGQSTPFNQQLIALSNPDFFYADFQFRFIARGESGMRNSWNVDYVKLDRNRSVTDVYHNDLAISHSLNTILDGYTAMPAFEFSNNPVSKLGNSVSTTYNNLMQSPLLISATGYSLITNPLGVADTFFKDPTIAAPPSFQNPLSGTPTVTGVQQGAALYLLKYVMFIKTNTPNTRLLYNDTVSRTLTLSNYFAYDDSTAETGFSLIPASTLNRAALGYEVSKPAIINAVRIYFTSVQESSIPIFNLKIWGDNNGVPASTTLHQQGVPIPAPTDRNKYIEIALTSPVQVNGKFYVGWSSHATGSGFTNIGLDLNNYAPGRAFKTSASNTNWSPLTDNQGNPIEAALMIRPVLAEVVGMDEELAGSPVHVFPNPAIDKVFISGEYRHITLLDISGRKLCTKNWNETQGELVLPIVPAGVYFIQIQTENSIKTQKLIITK